LGEEDLKTTKEFFGWNPEARFFIPEEAQAYFEKVTETCADRQKTWSNLVRRYRKAHPELARDFDRYLKGQLTPGWEGAVPAFSPENPLATRVASGKVLDAIAPLLPTLVGGSAT
jgi:transketolase